MFACLTPLLHRISPRGCGWLAVLALLLHGAVAWAGPGALAAALNPDGTVRAGATGSFDTHRYRMYTAPDGRPVFRPTAKACTAGGGDDQWQAGFGPGGADEAVLALLRVGTDLYVGGHFNVVGNVVAHHVARWDGTAWHSLGTGNRNGTNGDVLALAAVGTTLYAGGSFSTAGGTRANYLAAWNGNSWQALGAAPAFGLNNTVNALAAVGGTLYAGGSFTSAGGVAANFLAQWNGRAWSAVGTGVNSVVKALASDGNVLYAGGFFTQAGGGVASRVAKWDGAAWSALGTGTNDAVFTLVLNGAGVLYAGGQFAQAGGTAANYVAQWDGTAWSALGAGLANGVNGSVYALASNGASLTVGGYFTQAGGRPASYVAQWNGTSWAAVQAGTGLANNVQALAAAGAQVWAGGNFVTADEVGATFVAEWTGTAWTAVGPGLGLCSYGLVLSMAVVDSTLYVAGIFPTVGNVAANNVARWDGHAWSRLGAGPTNGTNGAVYALLVDGTDLYAGGTFTQAGGSGANNIAKWNGSAWQPLGAGVNNTVLALARVGPTLYAGGEFTQAGTVPAQLLARWNGTAWSALPAANATLQGLRVQALAVLGGTLFVSGDMLVRYPSSVVVQALAQWDGAAWSAVGGADGGNTLNHSALAVAEGVLYVGGPVWLANGTLVGPLAQWDGVAWSAFGVGLNTAGNVQVMSLAVASGMVYVGGFFYRGQTNSSAWPYNFVAKWNGRAWSSPGTGLNQDCRVLAPLPKGRLAAGGHFTGVSDTSRYLSHFSVYTDSLLPVLARLTLGTGASRPLTLKGANLMGTTEVRFSGPGGAPVRVTAGFVVNAAGTQLTVPVPVGAVSGPVAFTTPRGTSNSLPLLLPLATASGTAAVGLRVLPNPATHWATVVVTPGAGGALVLLDARGREVRRTGLPARTAAVALDVAGLPAGIYVVRYGEASTKLVVE